MKIPLSRRGDHFVAMARVPNTCQMNDDVKDDTPLPELGDKIGCYYCLDGQIIPVWFVIGNGLDNFIVAGGLPHLPEHPHGRIPKNITTFGELKAYLELPAVLGG